MAQLDHLVAENRLCDCGQPLELGSHRDISTIIGSGDIDAGSTITGAGCRFMGKESGVDVIITDAQGMLVSQYLPRARTSHPARETTTMPVRDT